MNERGIVQLGTEAIQVVTKITTEYDMSQRQATDVLARAFNRLSPSEQIQCLKRVPQATPKRTRKPQPAAA